MTRHGKERRTLAAAALAAVVAVQGCSSGSGGSQVGERAELGPVAIATIVGHPVTANEGSVSATVRAGSEVILSAGNSYGQDAPVLEFDWEPVNAAAQAAKLVTRSTTAKSFTVPVTTTPQTLEFELTVRDSHGNADTATATIEVEPITDQNRFLTYLLSPETFRVAAATSQALTDDLGFTVTLGMRVTYLDRQNLIRTYEATIDSKSGQWVAAVPPDPADPDAAGNPVLTFRLPVLDLDDVNAPYLDLPAGHPDRNRILDAYKVDGASVEAIVTLTAAAGGDPSQAVLFLRDADDVDIVAKGNATCQFDGTAQQCVVPLVDLGPQGGTWENAATASAYYTTIDPYFERTSLTAWLARNCFDPQAADYGADAHAVYTNNFDLGFGRDMYLKSGKNCTSGALLDGDVASVVINYSSLLLAAKKIDPIVAVAMEYSPPAADPAGERFTKFYVFAPDRSTGEMIRVGSANFDNRGEKFVPGVCAVCHGGRPAAGVLPGQPYPNDGNIGAIFMPWDLDSFLFTGPDGDPQKDPSLLPSNHPFLTRVDAEVMSRFTRANQEEALRKLNEAVLPTYPQDAPVRRLVHDWYSAQPDYASNTLTGTFRSHYVPAGWDVPAPGNSVQPRELYSAVIAQHCRACHTQLPAAGSGSAGPTQTIPTFETYQAFVAEMTDTSGQPTDRIIAPVFDLGVMPLARLTADRLWVPGASGERPADLLAAHLGVGATRVPGQPSATIRMDKASYVRGEIVRLDGQSESRFAEQFEWSLSYAPAAPCSDPGGAFDSQSQLVGQSTAAPAFNIDVPGDYTVALTVTGPQGQTFTAAPAVVSVQNNCPVAADRTTNVALGLSTTLDLNALGIGTPGDGAHSVQLVGTPVNVTASISNGVATIVCGAGCQQTPTSYFDFRILDADGDFDDARVMVTVDAAPRPTADDASFDVLARTTNFATSPLVTDALYTTFSRGGTGDRTISIATPPARGTISIVNGRTFTYTPNAGFAGTDSFTYRVTDQNPAEPQTDTGIVTVRVNGTVRFDNAIFTNIFTNEDCASLCHAVSGASANDFFDMSGNAAAVWPRAVIELRASEPLGSPHAGELLDWPYNDSHTGDVGDAAGWGAPAATCDANATRRASPYCVILRWKEEGACFLGANGQPTGATSCPAFP